MDLNQLRKLAGLPPAIIIENSLPNPSVEREFEQLSEKIEELAEQVTKMDTELMNFSSFIDRISFDISETQHRAHVAASALHEVIEAAQMELERLSIDIYGEQ